MVFPIACPHEDLLFSGFGVKLRAAAIFPSYVTVLVRAEDVEAKIVETGTGDDRVIMLQYEKVVAVEAQLPKHFRVEAFCQLQQAIRFNMCDGNVHLVIGKVTAEDDGSDMVLVTERVFKLQSEEQVKAVMAERGSIAAVQMISSKKRHAVDLVEETPLKVKSAKWYFFLSCKIIADADATGTVRVSRSVILCALHFFLISTRVALLDLLRVIGTVRAVEGRRNCSWRTCKIANCCLYS